MLGTHHAILRSSDIQSFSRGNGIYTKQMTTPSCGANALLNGFTDIPPGAAIPLHYHNCEESVLIISGTAQVEIDGAFFTAESGDVTWLPADVPHRFINRSDTEILRIFWTYTSTAATRTLVENGQTAPILAEHS